MSKGEITRAVRVYHGLATDNDHHRYKSWEHCYQYFRSVGPEGLRADRHKAALHLGFYLASWGMYRGSSFLLQHAYTVHLGLVGLIAEGGFADLWAMDVGAGTSDHALVLRLDELVESIRSTYGPFAQRIGFRPPTDTLVTKVVLGTFGCLPACDRYFIAGFRSRGNPSSALDRRSLKRILTFCSDNRAELAREQTRIESESGVRYPIMKIVDMCFWQLGYEVDERGKGGR